MESGVVIFFFCGLTPLLYLPLSRARTSCSFLISPVLKIHTAYAFYTRATSTAYWDVGQRYPQANTHTHTHANTHQASLPPQRLAPPTSAYTSLFYPPPTILLTSPLPTPFDILIWWFSHCEAQSKGIPRASIKYKPWHLCDFQPLRPLLIVSWTILPVSFFVPLSLGWCFVSKLGRVKSGCCPPYFCLVLHTPAYQVDRFSISLLLVLGNLFLLYASFVCRSAFAGLVCVVAKYARLPPCLRLQSVVWTFFVF